MPKTRSADGPIVAWCIAETQRLRADGLAGILVLPVPPSANAIWRRGRGKGLYKVDAATTFEANVAVICQYFKVKPIPGNVAISAIWFKGGKAGSDLDNRAKSLLDAIKGRCFEDDVKVSALRLERVEGCPTPHMRVMTYAWTQRVWPDWCDAFPYKEVV